MQLKYITLDAFASTRYQGNPVAIISVPSSAAFSLSQVQKQAIASEFNLSEVVFLHLPEDMSSQSRNIDIFTSHAEVPFAGHPTIGTSYYLLNILKEDVTTLITKAGSIPISRSSSTSDSVKASIPFNFHIHALTIPYSPSLTAPSVSPITHPMASIVNGMTFIYVELPTLESLASATTNLAPNGTYNPSCLDAKWQNGLIGTMYYVSQGTDSEGRENYRTRMFGTREDPGTGSASSGLACLLSEGKEGRSRFVFEQGVEMGRKNVIEVGVKLRNGGGEIEEVVLGGGAVKVMEGALEV